MSTTLKVAGGAAELYDIYEYTKGEFESRGISGSSLVEAWRSAPQSVIFAFKNPDAGIKALNEGITSASAVSIRFATFGLVEVHGAEVERWANAIERATRLKDR